MDWPPSCPDIHPMRCDGEDTAQWSNSPNINTRSWWKINVALQRNNSHDIVEEEGVLTVGEGLRTPTKHY